MKGTELVLAFILLIQYVFARPLQDKGAIRSEFIPSTNVRGKVKQPVGTIPPNYKKRQGIDELFNSHGDFDDFDDNFKTDHRENDDDVDNSDDISLEANSTQNSATGVKAIFKVDQPQNNAVKLHGSEDSLEGDDSKLPGKNIKSFTKDEESGSEDYDDKERQETSSIIENTTKFDKETQEMMKDTGIEDSELNNPTMDPLTPENYNEYDEPTMDITDENYASNEPTSDTTFANDNGDDQASDKPNMDGKDNKDEYYDSYGNFDEESTNPSEPVDQVESKKEEKEEDDGFSMDMGKGNREKVNDTKPSSEEVTESAAEEDHEMNDDIDNENENEFSSSNTETTSNSQDEDNEHDNNNEENEVGDEDGSGSDYEDTDDSQDDGNETEMTNNNNKPSIFAVYDSKAPATTNNNQTSSDNIVGNNPQTTSEAEHQALSHVVANNSQTPVVTSNNQTATSTNTIVENDVQNLPAANNKLSTDMDVADEDKTPAEKTDNQTEALSNTIITNDAETTEVSSNKTDTASYKKVGDEDDDEDSSMNEFPTEEELGDEPASISAASSGGASSTTHFSQTKLDKEDYHDSDANDDEVFEDEEESFDESETTNEYHPTVDAFLVDQIRGSDADIRSKVYSKQHPRQVIGLGPGTGPAGPMMMGHGMAHPLSGGRGIPGIDQYGFVGTNVPGFPPGYPLGTKWKSTDHGFVLDKTGFQHPLAPHQACQCGPYGCSCTPLATAQSGKIKSHTATATKTHKDLKGSKRALICRCSPLGCGCFPEKHARKRQKVDESPKPHPIDLMVGWPFGYGTNFGWVAPRPILPTLCPTGKRSKVKGKSASKHYKRCGVDPYTPNMGNSFAAEPFLGMAFGLHNNIGFGWPFSPGCFGSCTLGGQSYINNGPG